MATKKPLVLNSNGQIEQVQSADYVMGIVYNNQSENVTKTGNLLETVMCNLKVNGGDMGANGKMICEAPVSRLSGTSSIAWKMYVCTVGTNVNGNTGVPANSTQIGLYTHVNTNLTGGQFTRRLQNKNNQALNRCLPLTTMNVDYGGAAGARIDININTANDFWVVITATLGTTTDTAILDDAEIIIRYKQ